MFPPKEGIWSGITVGSSPFPSKRKESDKESLRGGRDQLRIPHTPPLQVVTGLTKNSSQYSLVKKKNMLQVPQG